MSKSFPFGIGLKVQMITIITCIHHNNGSPGQHMQEKEIISVLVRIRFVETKLSL